MNDLLKEKLPCTPDQMRAAISWFLGVSESDHWNLVVEEQAVLLGVTIEQLLKIKNSTEIDLAILCDDRQLIVRLSLLLGIYKALRIISSPLPPSVACKWFLNPSSFNLYRNKSPKDYILSEGTVESLYKVRRHLDSLLAYN